MIDLMELKPTATYEIELCSGERCYWQYLGKDANDDPLWRDTATGREFGEASLMYAWKIIAEASPPISGGKP